ncbi:DUF3568 family protein [Niveibacterium sp. 24ML]|uniref:DUF3568 family protein n=1 Tax=Niveibacterium sp. 24ML TaxID=2985512 RepID=UPI00226DD7DF|nr:DUF3568 family protein [Niveibacterium sp. 24ML]MCX9154676.1 DUF3568 family protein [Niveibacterium sp. 24ML]
MQIHALAIAGWQTTILRCGTVVLMVCLLNGCAALAVSLAGAGASAGLAHQINGTASRAFSEPFSKVDAAVRIATKRMQLEVDEVASTDRGQITKARVSTLDVSIELEPLSPTLTRVSVVARRDLLRVDGATAAEVVTQIERSLAAIAVAETAPSATPAKAESGRLAREEPPRTRTRKTSAPAKGKTTI